MLPLKNKTILITRSAKQAEDFINQLQKLGANTIALPLIENTAINQNDLTKKVTENKSDWIIFTSVNAVQFFFKTITVSAISSKIAVVGSKTKLALKEAGLNTDFIPSEFTAKCLANEIPVSTNQRILIPRSDLAKNDIIEILEKRNCVVKPISIYKNTSINYSKEKLDKVFNQHINFITFTSGSTIKSFVDLEIETQQEKIICIGPETAIVAEKNNIIVSAIANPHTIKGMVDAIKSLCY
jgi:uroporphyrinogen-III synthase